jgi:putative ABC transport system permease protein
MDQDVSWVGLAASTLLVVVAIGVSVWRRLGLERDMAIATARAAGQLLAVGSALALVLAPDAPLWWSWVWVVGIVGFAGATVRSRAPVLPGVLGISMLANGVTAVTAFGLVFGLGVFPLEPRTLVPIAGMVIGNAMKAQVVSAQQTVDAVANGRLELEARLALGQPSSVASRPITRSVLRTALSPQIETTKAVGLVFLPGAMTGLILAGVDPIDAVMVQAALMYIILGAVATSTAVITLVGIRRLFTRDHRLVPLPRSVTSTS